MASTKEERALALAEAEEAFNTIAEGSDRIVASKFRKLLRNLNVIYREEEHRVTLKKITEGEDVTVITRSAFLDCLDGWYQDAVEVAEKFDAFANGSNHISTADFPELLKKMDVNFYYNKDSIKKISEEVITRQAFLKWYHWYVFESLDDFSEEESDD